MPFLKAKGQTEQRLRTSGMTWTVLQPNLYMDTWIPAVVGPALAGQPVTLVGKGLRQHSMVAARDVASYAVRGSTIHKRRARPCSSVARIRSPGVMWSPRSRRNWAGKSPYAPSSRANRFPACQR
jgi:hypothetical protein